MAARGREPSGDGDNVNAGSSRATFLPILFLMSDSSASTAGPAAGSAASPIGPVEAFWRFRAWTVPVTVVVGLLAGLAALVSSGTSTATATLFLTDPRGAPMFRDGSSNPTDLERYAAQRAEFVESVEARQAVLDRIAAGEPAGGPDLGDEDLDSLDEVIDARPTSNADVRIDCTTTDPDRALAICGLSVSVYVDLSNADIRTRADLQINSLLAERDRLIADPDAQESSIAEIDARIAEIRSEAVLFGSGVEFVNGPAVEEDSRIVPAIQIGLAGLLFAAFATAAVAWFRAGRRPVVASGTDATGALRGPLLGELTDSPADTFAPDAPPGSAYQLLATSLGAVHPDGGIVLAGAPTPTAHVADTIARMATASAREGRRVLVIDGDLVERRLSQLFTSDNGNGGLTELLAGISGFDEVRRTVGVGGAASLDLVTSGRRIDDPSSLFRSRQARQTLSSFRSRYDLILIAVPPLLTVADGSALAGEADGVLLVVGRGAETHDLHTVRQRLEVLRAPLLGVVYDHRSPEQGR